MQKVDFSNYPNFGKRNEVRCFRFVEFEHFSNLTNENFVNIIWDVVLSDGA